MEISYSFGALIGALLIVLIVTVLFRETIFSKSKTLVKNGLSTAIASIASTAIYWFGPAKQLNLTYLIAGLIIFAAFQIVNSRNKKR